MKKMIYFLALQLACTTIASSEEIETNFSSPYQTVKVDTSLWSLEKSDKHMIEFKFINDSDVKFVITEGQPLKNNPTLDELSAQIKKVDGKISKVPLLRSSFHGIKNHPDTDSWGTSKWEESDVALLDYSSCDLAKHVIKQGKHKKVYYEDVNRAFYSIFIKDNRMYLLSLKVQGPGEKAWEFKGFYDASVQYFLELYTPVGQE